MIGDILIVVPARGGSKRVPRKNIRPLAGKPLLAYTLAVAAEAGLAAMTYVSTEDAEIAAVARGAGTQVIDRPAALAADASSTEDTLLHAVDVVSQAGKTPDWVVTLPPTSPFRRAQTLQFFIAAARQGPADALLSLTESRGDYWRCDAAGALARLFPDAPRRQQDRQPLYEENSAIYVTATDALRRTGSVLGTQRRGIVIDALEGFDINNEGDFATAEALMAHGVTPQRQPTLLACS